MLKGRFETLRRSLSRLLRENEDPISQCYDAIVQEGEAIAERLGAEERAKRSDAVSRIRDAMTGTASATELAPNPPPARPLPMPSRKSSVDGMPAVHVNRTAASAIFEDFGGGGE